MEESVEEMEMIKKEKAELKEILNNFTQSFTDKMNENEIYAKEIENKLAIQQHQNAQLNFALLEARNDYTKVVEDSRVREHSRSSLWSNTNARICFNLPDIKTERQRRA